ncbi:MAG: ABC transporter permease [Gemmatimonadaceae bacterium]
MDEDSLPSWRRYLRFWRSNVGEDVNQEIGFHLEGLIEQYVAAGMSRDDARRAALERFGDPERVASAMRALAQQREATMRRSEWLHGLGRDLRMALRQLAKRPSFTVVALATLALGIGANTAIFSAVNAVLLRPLPVRDLGRIVFLYDNLPKLNLLETPLDPSETLALTARSDLFEAAGGVLNGSSVLTGVGEPQRLARSRTMGRFFDAFGVVPQLGRFYRPDESENGNHLVAVLSHDFWRELGADRGIVGRKLTLNGESYEVVGVMQPGFRYPRGVQLWSPYPVTPETRENHGRLMMNTVGKLRPGASQEQLQAKLDAFMLEAHPNATRTDFYMSSRGFVSAFAGELRPTLIVLLAAVGFVLLIACANIASLQLVHGSARTREMAVRAALGAGRWTIVRQLLVENLVISIGGGLLGLLVGLAALRLLAVAGAAELPALQGIRFDNAVLLFTALATIVSGLVFGLAPALRAGRVDLQEGLKEGTRNSLGARKNRLLQASVVVQVALTLVLLLGSTLMIRTLRQLLAQNPGFNPDQVHTMRLAVTGPRSRSPQLTQFYDELLQRLRAVSAFDQVGLVSELPFSGSNDSSPFVIRGKEADPNGPALHANLHTIGGDYFKAMHIPLLRGRAFNEADIKSVYPWVAIIDETLAKQFFGDEDPIGRKINQGPDAVIIGIVGTVSQGELGEAPKATIYYPYAQHDWYSTMYVTVRSALPLATVQGIVRSELNAIDGNVPLFEARMLDERIGVSLAPRHLTMTVLTGLAVLSLALAVFGLYGVVSYAVSQRTTEFGIRIALGAQSADVRGMVLKQGLALGLVGVVVGLAAALLATRALSSLIFGISARDPVSFVGAALVLTVVTVVAAYIPARRATAVSPVETLRLG